MLIAYGTASAQVVFKGPIEGKPNKMNKITIEKIDGDDLKIQAFLNGKPVTDAEGDYTVMKNLDDQKIIFILTDKEGVFTFVAAVNKAGKTLVTNHVMTIGVPKPDPVIPPGPAPGPVVPDNTLGAKLKTAYRVSPDAASLNKLIQILEEVNSSSYKNYDEMELVLSVTAKKYLPNGELQKLRDLIGDEIVAKAGIKNSDKDITKVKAVLTEAIAALKSV